MSRHYGNDCVLTVHQPGDRHRSWSSLDQEWTGSAWTPVCPTDDVAIAGRDEDGWLCCQVCGTRAVDLAGSR